ncbi:MAG: hypothetical protein ACO263_11585 [Cyclobacteriaceae bacterium]
MKRFRFLILCVAVSLAETAILWLLAIKSSVSIPSLWIETLVFYVILTVALHAILPVSLPPVAFGSRYLFTLVSRFMITVAYMVISGIIAPEGILPNTLFILSNYVLFLALEVAYLFQSLNGPKKGRMT